MFNGEIIINADDFGESSAKNRAISEAFNRGWITSATIMANGDAFEEACQLARDNKLVDRIGVHINLYSGKPLTENLLKYRRLINRDGEFELSFRAGRKRNWLPLTPFEKKALFDEISAQINRCRCYGLPIIHADSHHHQHNELTIFPVMVHALRANNVCYLRPLRNMGTGISRLKHLYKKLINMQLQRSRLMGVDLFGEIDDFIVCQPWLVKGRHYRVELMCHPQYDQRSQIVDLDGMPLLDKIQQARTVSKGFATTYYARLSQETGLGHMGNYTKDISQICRYI